MPGPILLVSTCGTSLLSNLARQRAAPQTTELLKRTANLKDNELSPEDLSAIQAVAEDASTALARASICDLRRMAAELNGLLGFYRGDLAAAKGNHHIFLHTDTFQGSLAADRLAGALRSRGLATEVLPVRDLNVADPEAFTLAMNELVDWSRQTLPGYRSTGYRIVFNLVGGFKAFQAFMQTLGMFYADEILYIFEASNALLRIPRLPVAFDDTARGIVADNLPLFRQLSLGPLPLDRCRALPETLISAIDDEATLSPWGKLLWDQCCTELYRRRLLDPPIPRIRYSDPFRKKCDDLARNDPDKLLAVNQRIDDLADLLLHGRPRNRLDLKKLSGNPKPPATHELDLTAHGAAWRAFGHYEGDTFVLDSLGPHL